MARVLIGTLRLPRTDSPASSTALRTMLKSTLVLSGSGPLLRSAAVCCASVGFERISTVHEDATHVLRSAFEVLRSAVSDRSNGLSLNVQLSPLSPSFIA